MKLIICALLLSAFSQRVFTLIADWELTDVDPEKWNKIAEDTIASLLKRKPNNKIAKNLILFLGDGMGVNTVNAGRIRKGQKLGNSLFNESPEPLP